MLKRQHPAAATIALLVLAGTGPACLAQQAATAKAPEIDAKFIKMEVPAKLLTDQVFLAKITVKNTGSATWKCTGPAHLRSLAPAFNATWGTSIMRAGQGAIVKPGDVYTFVSNLKAPGAAGEAVFQWQLAKGKTFFGEPTGRQTIQVSARAKTPAWPSAPKDPSGKHVLTYRDFEYVGSFKLPANVGKGAGTWSEGGIALRTMADGTKRLFVNYTHPARSLFEVQIPPLVKLADFKHAALKVAEVKKVWGDMNTGGVGANGGIFWDEAAKTLYWTTYHGYKTGGDWPVLAASKLGADGKVTHAGPWRIPKKSAGWYKSYWGGVTQLSKAFADKYTGGRTLALGFGGYYSIYQATSRGPSLGAIATPSPAKKTLDIVDLLVYPTWVKGAYAPRDGDYFLANIWGDQPDGPKKGYWTANDHVRAGVWIDLPDKHGFIAFCSLATGRVGYDASAIYSAGTAQWWYCYNPADLGPVGTAKGPTKPWKVLPVSRDKVVYPRAAKGGFMECIPQVTGSCFDAQTQRLYVYKPFAIPVSREVTLPCIHVYRVK